MARRRPGYLTGLREFVEVDVMPIKPTVRRWALRTDSDQGPRRIIRTYEFDNYHALCVFVVNIMQYQDEEQHHAKVTIEDLCVTVELYTHDFGDVTELDTDMAKTFDALFEEVSAGGIDTTGPAYDLC